jgi:outer membrane protein insertion porin family
VLGILAFLTALHARPVLAVDELDYGLTEHRVARIKLSGNETFSTKELKDLLQIREPSWMRPLSVPRYRPDLIDTQLRLIERYYQRQGFHQVIVNLDSTGVVPTEGDILYISVQEGPRTLFARVTFVGGDPFTASELRKDLRYLEGEPAPADLNDLGGDLYTLRSRYWDQAYLAAIIVPTMTIQPTADPNRYGAYLQYDITPGNAYRVRKIDIEGYRRTRLNLITRELTLAEGDPFSWKKVEESRRNMLDTSLFRDVSLIPANEDSSTGQADLIISVVERKPAYYELGFGVGNVERVRILAAWGNNNLFGSGRRLSARGRVFWNAEEVLGAPSATRSIEINYRADLLYTNPHIRGSRFRLETDLFASRLTRGASGLLVNTLGFAFGTQFRGGRTTVNTVTFQLVEDNPEPLPGATQTEIIFEQNQITRTQTRSIQYSIFLEERSNVIYPVHGSQASVRAEVAGGLLGGDNSFLRGEAAYHTYTPFFVGGVLAFRVRLGAARPYGDSRERGADGIPYTSRFFAGGAASVRGFLERSLGPQATPSQLDSLSASGNLVQGSPATGGNYLLLTSVEWRFPLPLLSRWNFWGTLFFDGGNAWASASDIRLEGFRLRSYPLPASEPDATQIWDYRYSVGWGVRFNTPAGPFRFDVGYPLKRAVYVDADGVPVRADDKFIWYFSLGYPF